MVGEEKPLRGIDDEDVGMITGLRVRGRNNYSLVAEQDLTPWQSKRITHVSEAIGLDEALADGIQRRGCSGTGAGARLLATVVDVEGEETEIEVAGLHDPLVADLPFGSVRQMYRFAAQSRGYTVWDGHNYISPGCPATDELIERYREHRRAQRGARP